MTTHRLKSLFLLLALSLCASERAAGDLVAYYPMNEGIGNTVFDASGNNNHGTVFDGSWIFGPFGTALYFDGYSDGHINCGKNAGLNIEERGSVQVWFKPEAPIQGGLVCWGLGGSWAEQRFTTLLNDYGNYEEFGVYLADGTDYFRPYRGAFPPIDTWTCLTVTFTGRSIDIYLDGVLKETAFQQIKPGIEGFDLLIGKAFGWTQYGLFRGVIDEARIYNHCLSSEEVFELYKTEAVRRGKDTSGFETILITPQAYPRQGIVVVDMDYRGLAPVPYDLMISADLFKTRTGETDNENGSPPPWSASPKKRHQALFPDAQQCEKKIISVTARKLPVWGKARAEFHVKNLTAGPYTIRVRAFHDHTQVGITATSTVSWPGRDPAWEGITILNNLCWELLNLSGVENPGSLYEFSHPRQGWIYFSTQATGSLTFSVNGAVPSVIHDPAGAETQTAMRWIEAGPVQLEVTGTGSLEKLMARAVPALVFGHWPNVKTGLLNKEDHAFLTDYVLPHANTIMDHGNQWFTDPWVNQEGKHWHQIVYKPQAEASGTAQGIFEFLTSLDGLAHPDLHAVQLDEFYPSTPLVQEWTDACSAILCDPQFDGRMIIPYFGGNVWDHADCTAFLQTITSAGSWIAYEAYYPEMETEDRAWFSVNRQLTRTVDSLEQVIPGVTNQLQVVLSYLTEFAGENSDTQANLKVFMDMQFQQLATEPGLFGIPAIEEYVSHHSDEESIRWAAALFRHYALEGNCNRLSTDPYTSTHLQNGDFLNGILGWILDEAEPGSMDVKSFRGLGILQHRRSYGYGTVVPFLWTRRCAIQPNAYSQTLTGLDPDRLYSLELITGDYHDLVFGQSIEKVHALSIDIQGADLLTGPEYSFRHASGSYGTVGAFSNENPYWMNLHYQVFRPVGVDVILTLSDWLTPTDPGGPTGQELIHSHIEVQPYYPDPH